MGVCHNHFHTKNISDNIKLTTVYTTIGPSGYQGIFFFLFLHRNICCGYSLEVPLLMNPTAYYFLENETIQQFSVDKKRLIWYNEYRFLGHTSIPLLKKVYSMIKPSLLY